MKKYLKMLFLMISIWLLLGTTTKEVVLAEENQETDWTVYIYMMGGLAF